VFGFVVANILLTSRELSDIIGISIAQVFCLFTGRTGRPVSSGSGSKAHDAGPWLAVVLPVNRDPTLKLTPNLNLTPTRNLTLEAIARPGLRHFGIRVRHEISTNRVAKANNDWGSVIVRDGDAQGGVRVRATVRVRASRYFM
jgi:hypothetical protein